MKTSQIKALFEQRSNAANELRSLYDSAGDAELSAEAIQTEERLNGAIGTADERIKALLTLSEGEERAAGAFESLGAEERQPDVAPAASDEDILRAVGKGEQRSAEFSYEARGTDPLLKSTAEHGGNTVPTTFYNTLVESMVEYGAILGLNPTTFRTSGGEKILIPTATAFPAAALVAEGNQIGQQDATFAQKELDAYKYAFTMRASSELLDDTAINLVEFLARRGGEALGNATSTAALLGTGSSQPQGLIHSSGGLGTTGSASGSVADGFVADDWITLVHSVTRPYRAGAVLIMNDSTVATARRLVGDDGQYIWQPSMAAGEPDRILGYPVITDPNVVTSQTNGHRGAVFVNVNKALAVRFAGPVRVEASTDFAFDTDMTVWRFIMRFDSEVIDAAAGKVLTYTT